MRVDREGVEGGVVGTLGVLGVLGLVRLVISKDHFKLDKKSKT
jgi:hypothetical protein